MTSAMQPGSCDLSTQPSRLPTARATTDGVISSGSSKARRWATGYAAVSAAAIIGNGVRLRNRLMALPTLGADNHDVTAVPLPDVVFLVAAEVDLDERTAAAAVEHMARHSLSALDVIPADLPMVRALDVVRMVNPVTFRSKPLEVGRGAGQVLCVTTELADRAGLQAGEGIGVAAMVEATLEAKRHAPRAMAHAVSPWLRSSDQSMDERAEQIRAIFGSASSFAPAVALMQSGGLAAATAVSPLVGAVAFAASTVQPALVFGGTPIQPRDLATRSATRTVKDPADAVQLALALDSTAEPKATDEDRRTYAEAVANGTDHFFEERRATCPWCSSAALTQELETTDLLQHKPGTFVIDRCESCGHRFQNPRLTIAGLDYYYRDFYDGIGAESADFVFGATDRSYVGRAELVKRHSPTPPRRWLDVGTGHGHFCLVAADVLPDTTFDGLDMTDGIDEAARRGWVDVGHRGMLPELADDLVGQYDVISMHHYLEHTREPREEIEAAARILTSGGYLMIEVPNPESVMGRVLGRWWVPWFQPQHQHLVPHGNLVKALDELGFDIAELEIAAAHQPVDLTMAAWFGINHVGVEVDLPWRPKPRFIDKVRRAGAFVLGAPALVAALLIDNLSGPILTRTDGGNTYRLLAKKR